MPAPDPASCTQDLHRLADWLAAVGISTGRWNPPSIGIDTAGQLLVTAGDNPGRGRSEAAWAPADALQKEITALIQEKLKVKKRDAQAYAALIRSDASASQDARTNWRHK